MTTGIDQASFRELSTHVRSCISQQGDGLGRLHRLVAALASFAPALDSGAASYAWEDGDTGRVLIIDGSRIFSLTDGPSGVIAQARRITDVTSAEVHEVAGLSMFSGLEWMVTRGRVTFNHGEVIELVADGEYAAERLLAVVRAIAEELR